MTSDFKSLTTSLKAKTVMAAISVNFCNLFSLKRVLTFFLPTNDHDTVTRKISVIPTYMINLLLVLGLRVQPTL